MWCTATTVWPLPRLRRTLRGAAGLTRKVFEDEYSPSTKGLIDKYQGMIDKCQSGGTEQKNLCDRVGICTGSMSHVAPDECVGTKEPTQQNHWWQLWLTMRNCR